MVLTDVTELAYPLINGVMLVPTSIHEVLEVQRKK